MAIPDKESCEATKTSFNVVGESYVHGITDGQIESDASNCTDIRLV